MPPRRTHFFRTTATEVLGWEVERLWAQAASLPVTQTALSELASLLEAPVWLGDGPLRDMSLAPLPSLRAVAVYARESYLTDLDYPIILSAEGEIMDGRHRLVKAWMLGLPTIAVVRFPTTPPLDQRRSRGAAGATQRP